MTMERLASTDSYLENFTENEEESNIMPISSPQSPEVGFAASEENSVSLESSSSNELKICNKNGKKTKATKRKSRKTSNSLLFPTTSSMPAYYQYLLLHSLQMDDEVEIILPKDPRRWSKDDVNVWLVELSLEHNINPTLDSTKFPFNGKALCTLKMEMFVSRVPEFGKMLFKDVQLRLAKALLAEKVDK